MTYTSRLDIPDHIRKASIALLQARLSDSLDLEAQMKQAHWNVKGRDFIQLHELFDKVHGIVEDYVDTIAERITALGGVADGRIQTTVKASSLYEYPVQAAGGEAHLKAVAAVLAQSASRSALILPPQRIPMPTPPICSRRFRAKPTSSFGSSKPTCTKPKMTALRRCKTRNTSALKSPLPAMP
jgi:starvation-inducible DNA-binding protein